MADVIDYTIHGEEMQLVEIELDPGEGVRAEAGAMMYMGDGIAMQTGTGGGLFSGFKRMLTGEGFFITSFGGEGFILQRLRGGGLAFVHAGGTIIRKDLQAGETLRVDTGALVAMTPSIDYSIKFVGGFTNALFGGEGLFVTTLEGPGTVWLQSLPFSRLADRIAAALPQDRNKG